MQQSRIFDVFASAKKSNRETRFFGESHNERRTKYG